MTDIRFRRDRETVAAMQAYLRSIAEDNGREVGQLKRNLRLALREELTDRQRQTLLMYYAQDLNMREIAEILGVDRSTVSRTILRGERRLQRCLRYGAARLLGEPKRLHGRT